eukprot:1737188-Amphidinium_carterae.2
MGVSVPTPRVTGPRNAPLLRSLEPLSSGPRMTRIFLGVLPFLLSVMECGRFPWSGSETSTVP